MMQWQPTEEQVSELIAEFNDYMATLNVSFRFKGSHNRVAPEQIEKLMETFWQQHFRPMTFTNREHLLMTYIFLLVNHSAGYYFLNSTQGYLPYRIDAVTITSFMKEREKQRLRKQHGDMQWHPYNPNRNHEQYSEPTLVRIFYVRGRLNRVYVRGGKFSNGKYATLDLTHDFRACQQWEKYVREQNWKLEYDSTTHEGVKTKSNETYLEYVRRI